MSGLWRIARRDLSARIRGLRLLAVCLFLGVATLAAIGSLTAGVTEELARRGQSILGGDIEIAIAQREANADEKAAFRNLGTLSETIRIRSMAIGQEGAKESVLAELKAVDAAYPLYGALTLEGQGTVKPPATGTIFVGPSLANRLSLKPGSALKFGETVFTVGGIIAQEPDRLGEGFTVGPVAMITMADLPKTQLIQPGSMFESKYRIKLPPNADPATTAKALIDRFPTGGWEITERSNGAPGTRRFIERMGQFLTLVGLASLIIAGIGVGNGVGSYLDSKRTSIATLKVNGADSGMILKLYMMQIFTVAIAAVVAGLTAGILAVPLIGWAAGDVLPVAPGFAFHPLPLVISAAYGLLIAFAFAMPPLARARTVPAAGLFRAVSEERTLSFKGQGWPTLTVIAAIALVVTLAILSAREPLFSAGFIGAAFGLLLILTGLAALIRWAASRWPRPKSPLPRLALANLHRPGAQTRGLVVALGLGLSLFVTLATIQTSIQNEIKTQVPEKAPSFFVLDIPRAEADRFKTMVQQEDASAEINMIPALRGTVTEYAGQRVADLKQIPEGAWILNGDRGLTYSAAVPEGSRVVAGQWWAADYKGPPLVSVYKDVADALQLKVGDTLTVSVLGVELQSKVASIRDVQWENFGLNYAMVFSPGSFDAAPHNLVATVTVPKDAEKRLARTLPPAFPSASLIEVGDVVNQVSSLLTQMAQAIAAAASIAIFAGIAVLVGAIAAARQSRLYDSVILKLLGSTRRQILGAQAMEYGLLALILGVLALAIGLGGGWFVITQIFKFNFAPDPMILAITLLGGTGLTFILGMIGSLPILAARPADALRSL
jgi:putative ABC transport system permease protein